MTARRRLPNRRNGEIVAFEHEGQKYRATFGRFAGGELAEVFLDVGKPGTTVQMHADDAAVLASLLLQHDVPPQEIRHSISGPIAIALAMVSP